MTDPISTMCGVCGDNQTMSAPGEDNIFEPHDNRQTGEPCPGEPSLKTLAGDAEKFREARENLGRAIRDALTPTLHPGRRYKIVEPDGFWIMAGLSTGGDEAEVIFVREEEWKRRQAQRPQAPRPPSRSASASDMAPAMDALPDDGRGSSS